MKDVCRLVFLCLAVLFLFFIIHKIHVRHAPSWKEKYEDAIRNLVRQTSRWATAADQDQNAVIATLHSNYAMGYVMALQQTENNEEIQRITGVDMKWFQNQILRVQQKSTQKLVMDCPRIAPRTPLAVLAGEAPSLMSGRPSD